MSAPGHRDISRVGEVVEVQRPTINPLRPKPLSPERMAWFAKVERERRQRRKEGKRQWVCPRCGSRGCR